MNIDEQLNQVFNLDPEEVATEIQVYEDEEVDVFKETGDELEDDLNASRRAFKDLMKTNEVAIEQISKIATAYENPRGFEVLGQLIKAQAELAKELIDFHKKKQALKAPAPEVNQSINTQNNIVFNGSTSELLKELSKNARTEPL